MMELQPEQDPAAEIRRLQRCLNDTVSVLALPAIWSGGGPSQLVRILLDVLMGMLRLDLIYVRLTDPVGEGPVEMAQAAPSRNLTAQPEEIGEMVSRWLGPDPRTWAPLARNLVGGEDITIVSLQLGLQGEIGVIVAGSQRADFPGQTERLLLSVAATQAAIGLQEARLLSEQRRVTRELDQRVAERTGELAAANEALKREIAQRKRSEEELRRSEAFLAEGQRLSSTGSFSWSTDADEITLSEELFRIFGFEQDEPATLERISARVHPEDIPLLNDTIERARRTGGDLEHDMRLRMPDGSIKYLRTISHATRDQNGQLEYIGAIQDVTPRRLSEEALGKARSELAHVARVASLGALAASIAHEVNQPLSGIITNANACLRMLAADPPNIEGARKTAQRTIRDGDRASDVITRLRALFGKKGGAAEPVNLNEATREVIALSLSELQRNRVILRTEFADELPTVGGDRVQLQQVILNLFLNASDAMNGIDDRPRQLVIRTEPEGEDRVRLSVQDAGAGFGSEDMEKLFEAFYTTKPHGMGIGLSISRSIIESHGGRLWAAPNEGAGVTFSFSIPRGAEGAAQARGS